MALRTYEYFICSNGHHGVEKTTENDQPYSGEWEKIVITGMVTTVAGGKSGYRCDVCGELMSSTDSPKP